MKKLKKSIDFSSAESISPVHIATIKPLSCSLQFSYFYNGKTVYCFNHQFPWNFICFPDVNANSLIVKPWAIHDDQYLIVGDAIIELDSSRCKRIGKHAHYYFVVNGLVLRPEKEKTGFFLVPMKSMDASTLEVHDEFFAEDSNAFYIKGGVCVDKCELGDSNFSIDDYWGIVIAKGNKRVWLSDIGFSNDIDASTFLELKKIDELSGFSAFESEDIYGPFKVFKSKITRRVFFNRPARNDTELQVFLQEEFHSDFPNTSFPVLASGSGRANYLIVKKWFGFDLDAKWKYHAGDLRFNCLLTWFLDAVYDFCIEEPNKERVVNEIDCALQIYINFVDYVWLTPALLHSVARLYGAIGCSEKIVACCEKALDYRFIGIKNMLADPAVYLSVPVGEFESLSERAKSLECHLGYISLELLSAYEFVVESIKSDKKLVGFLERHILYEYEYYSADVLDRLLSSDDGDSVYWCQLDKKIRWYFENKMLLNFIFQGALEDRKKIDERFNHYRNHQYFNPVALISKADDLFRDVHRWAGWQEDFFSDNSNSQSVSRKMLQAKKLIREFEVNIDSLPDYKKAIYQQQATEYFVFSILGGS